MTENNPELEKLRAFTFGMQSAFIATIGALIRTHPNPRLLRQFLDTYYQREQAYLENKPLPEHVIDSFQQMWARVEVEIQQAEQDCLQQLPPQE